MSNDGQLGACCLCSLTRYYYIYTLQRSSSSIFVSSLGSIQARTWQRLYGKQWSYTASLGGYVIHKSSTCFVNVFTDCCDCNGQCQQQQHANDIPRVTMPPAGRLILSARFSHAMHASHYSFGGNKGVVITCLDYYSSYLIRCLAPGRNWSDIKCR